MTKRTWGAAAVGLLSLLVPQTARAQMYVPPATTPFPRPVVSPYLNLARGGNPAINYYGIVRPQAQLAGSIQTLQQQALAGQAALAAEVAATLPTTGHPTRFMNYSHYFMNPGGLATPTTGAAYRPNPFIQAASVAAVTNPPAAVGVYVP